MEDLRKKHEEVVFDEYQEVFLSLQPNTKELMANAFAGAANCFRKEGTKAESMDCAKLHTSKISDFFKRSQALVAGIGKKFEDCSKNCTALGDDLSAADSCFWDCRQNSLKDIAMVKAEVVRLTRR